MISKIRRFLRKMLASFVGEVPAESARCEYICSRLDCPPEAYANCKKRQEYLTLHRDN